MRNENCVNEPKMKELVNHTKFKVRFSEVDSMRVVWHGNYLKYFEDGREAFGVEHDLDYLKIYNNGHLTPIVHSQMDYKASLRYGETGLIETKFINSPAAKIVHEYKISNADTGQLLVTGKTIQVFMDVEGVLQLNNPSFFEEWKKSKGLL